MPKLFFFLILILFTACQNKKKDSSVSKINEAPRHIKDPRSSLVHDDYSMKHTTYYEKRFYQPVYPLTIQTYENKVIDFEMFQSKHGYSSNYKPLIGKVTSESDDLEAVNEFLYRVHQKVEDKELSKLITEETLAKVVAYRNLKIGQKITVPTLNKKGKSVIVIYKVEKIFDLLGMPAFALAPNKKKAPYILLFRGTDLSASIKGISSVLADLDLSGPGMTAFYSSQDEIHDWLLKAARKNQHARAIGYSLGGSLVQYTCIYEGDLLSKDRRFPSIAFNQPGVSEDLVLKWNHLSPEKKPLFKGYITEGDIVSSVGKLIGDVSEFTLDYRLEPLFAHVTLMSIQQRFYLYPIDVTLKNELDYSAETEKTKGLFQLRVKKSSIRKR